MAKKRVHELAKEFKIESKEMIRRLSLLGITVKSHASTVDEKDEERLRKQFEKERAVKAQIEPKPSIPDTAKTDPGADRKWRDPKYTSGPGLVDRVPSRPPDRRFQERPFLKGDILRAKAAQPAVQPTPPAVQSTQPAVQPAPPTKEAQAPAAGAVSRPVQEPLRKRAVEKPSQGYSPRPEKPQSPPARGENQRGARNQRSPAAGAGRPVRDTKGLPVPKLKPEQLKVPKVPDEVKAQERVVARPDKQKGEKARPAGEGRSFGRGKEWRDQRTAEQKLRPVAGGRRVQSQPRRSLPPHPVEKKPVVIGETVTIQELASKMRKSPAEVIKKLMALGVMATINQEIDNETAIIVAGELGFEVQVKIELDQEAMLEQENEEDTANLQSRPCVVTVMGHVDHGKTSLLDAIRETNVIASEVGGITQHIGAYQVERNNKKITFIDTPGHEAFTAMRARGARITDIAVLVIAAEDGVMPQTIEAINHAKAAGVPIIVAINKIDKPDANVDKVKQQLTEYGLIAEEWGGQTICIPVSAKTGQGLDELLEMILLVAEVNDLRTNSNRSARGTIIEAKLDKGRGPVATVLIQEGTLHIGDNIIAGTASGRVRAMMDYQGRRLKNAGPSTPAEVLGFSDVPSAGDTLYAVAEEKMARQIAAKRILRKREENIKTSIPRVSLDDLFKQIEKGQIKDLNIIIKADVQGSAEALRQSLEGLSTQEVRVNTIHSGVGMISEADILLASASNAIIVGFNVRPSVNARRAAELEKVDVRMYRVIYDAINDVKAAMSGLLEPEYKEVVIGRAEVRKTFRASRIGTIAGCYVTEGKITRDAKVKIIREDQVVFEGKLDSLKRFKDDVREVMQGYECGLAVEKFNEIKEGDIIEVVATEIIKREL
ncbi:MAG: Translation initiation factor IF-2 [Desulfotomaculum sp. 46_296]|nr:MAG: Translation initiation factor IF-2 [Desulfotomaculum sp. 46_296]HAU31483.1 translation initiation factor IF-2 [Desulfotomaculum sp.]